MIDWVAWALVKVFGGLACRLPPAVCVRIGEALGGLAMYCRPKRVRIGLLNLKAVFGSPRPGLPAWAGQAGLTPREARRIIRGIFRNIGAGVLEMLRLPAIDKAYIDRYVELVGHEHFDAALASGRPVILLTAHFGNWELTSIIAALTGHPIVALARAQQGFPRLYKLLVSYRESKGCYIVHKGQGMRRLVQAIKRGDLTGVVGDQASRQGLFVDFFGRPALFATGPFELARSNRALIVPGFIHRLRGPFHRGFLEPVIDLAQEQGTAEAVVRGGIERFAALLERHIEQDPAQWLWMHKRWKHTPARRVLILSDGKLGHVKQSMTVLQAMKERSAFIQERIVEVRYRHRLGRAVAFAAAALAPWLGTLRVLRFALTPACFRETAGTFADLVVSCGAATAPINVLLAAENRAKSIVVMNPGLPLRRFALALVPSHDAAPARPNVLRTLGALSAITDEELAAARDGLRRHPQFRGSPGLEDGRPVIAVLLGGDTDEYAVTTGFVETLLRQILAVCEDAGGCCLVTTSRRTSQAVERLLSERLAHHPRCAMLLLASRDELNGTVPGMLGWASTVVVTGESISMLSEACASGRPVVVVEPPVKPSRRAGATKPRRFLRLLAEQGYVHHHPLPEVGHAIRRGLSSRTAGRRLDTYAAVREAVARLL